MSLLRLLYLNVVSFLSSSYKYSTADILCRLPSIVSIDSSCHPPIWSFSKLSVVVEKWIEKGLLNHCSLSGRADVDVKNVNFDTEMSTKTQCGFGHNYRMFSYRTVPETVLIFFEHVDALRVQKRSESINFLRTTLIDISLAYHIFIETWVLDCRNA